MLIGKPKQKKKERIPTPELEEEPEEPEEPEDPREVAYKQHLTKKYGYVPNFQN